VKISSGVTTDNSSKRELKKRKVKEHNEAYAESKKPKPIKAISKKAKDRAITLMLLSSALSVDNRFLDIYKHKYTKENKL
jgi:hypothetical protein